MTNQLFDTMTIEKKSKADGRGIYNPKHRNPKIQVATNLPFESVQDLDRIAFEYNLSRSGLIAQIIENFFVVKKQ